MRSSRRAQLTDRTRTCARGTDSNSSIRADAAGKSRAAVPARSARGACRSRRRSRRARRRALRPRRACTWSALAALGVVHQLVGALDQLGRELARHAAALGDGAEAQADDADVDPDRDCRASRAILAAPVVRLDRLLEALGDLGRLARSRGGAGIRKQNSSPPNRACRSRVSLRALEREKVLGTDLIRQDPRDALDDLVADGVAERVVVALEAGDVDDADAAPADALLDGQDTTRAAP